MREAPARPLLRYLGSKWRLAPWIIGHFPQHEIYVEPFGGAAAVLLQKPRCRSEVYGDVDGELVNLFSVLRSPEASQLIRHAALTPYARAEYLLAMEPAACPLERARRLLVRSHMGHGTRGTRTDRSAGFRSDGTTGTTRVAGEWADFPEQLRAIVERLRGVAIESRPAAELIAYWDDPRVLLYLDPPYMPETRSGKARQREVFHAYAHEMVPEDHVALLEQVRGSRSMVILSGYETDLYNEALKGWSKRTARARAHRNLPRTEVLWLNPAAVAGLEDGPLFAEAAE